MSGCGAEPGLIDVDHALSLLLEQSKPLPSSAISIHDAFGRYLAEDIYAPYALPLFDQSAVDGYALCTEHSVIKGQQFECIAEIKAGDEATISLALGQAARIFTGAKIPDGTTTIARQEYVHRLENSKIHIDQEIDLQVDTRFQGEEISYGQLLAPKGQHLTVGAIAALCMAGVKYVVVYQLPRIAVIVSGDEISDNAADQDQADHNKIFDANTPLIMNWLKTIQQSADHFYVKDTLHEVKHLIHQLSQSHDFILTTGGVSVGDYDFIRPATLSLGFKEIFWKVKQKPGKPMFFATLPKNANQSCYLLGLPGNPAAVYVGLSIYASTLIAALQGQQQPLSWYNAELTDSIKQDLRARFLRMHVQSEGAVLRVSPLKKQQSHMLSNLMQANCWAYLEENQQYHAGQTVKILFI